MTLSRRYRRDFVTIFRVRVGVVFSPARSNLYFRELFRPKLAVARPKILLGRYGNLWTTTKVARCYLIDLNNSMVSRHQLLKLRLFRIAGFGR